MRSIYTVHHEGASENDQSRKKEKLDWWWAILLILIISILICLVIVGFYDLPGASDYAGDIDAYNAYKRTSIFSRKHLEDFSTAADLLVKIKQTKQISDRPNYPLDVRYEIFYDKNETFGRTPGNIQAILVSVKVKHKTPKWSIIIRSWFEDTDSNHSERISNRIVNAMIESLNQLIYFPANFQHKTIFLFQNKSTNNRESSDWLSKEISSEDTSSAIITIRSIPGGTGPTISHTQTSSLQLLQEYYGSFNRPNICLICSELSKLNFTNLENSFKLFAVGIGSKNLELLYFHGEQVKENNTCAQTMENMFQKKINRNLLLFIQNLNAMNDLEEGPEPRNLTESIFFDFFGIFMVVYSKTDDIAINVVVSLAGLAAIAYSLRLMQQWAAISALDILMEFGVALGVQLGSLTIGSGLTLMMANLYDLYKHLIPSIPKYWLVFGIYFCPFLFTMCILPNLYLGWKKFKLIPLRFGIMLFQHVNCVLFIIAILLLTGLSVRMAFVVVSGIAFYTLSLIINEIFKLHTKPFAWMFPILIGQILPLMFVAYLMMIFYSVYIPASDSQTAPENIQLLLALSAIGFSMLMLGFTIPFISIFRKSKTILVLLVVVMLIFIILIFTNLFSE